MAHEYGPDGFCRWCLPSVHQTDLSADSRECWLDRWKRTHPTPSPANDRDGHNDQQKGPKP